jgi:hypothetical protein
VIGTHEVILSVPVDAGVIVATTAVLVAVVQLPFVAST